MWTTMLYVIRGHKFCWYRLTGTRLLRMWPTFWVNKFYFWSSISKKMFSNLAITIIFQLSFAMPYMKLILGIYIYVYSTSNKYKVFAKIGHSQALYWGFTKVISWQLSGNLNLIDLDIYLNCSWIYNYYYSERILFTTIVHSSEKRCLRSTFWPSEMLCLCTKKTQELVSFIFQLWVFTLHS